jgi:hypothetical protein
MKIRKQQRSSLQVFCSCICVWSLAPSLFAAEPSLDFSRDIRPILSNACFHCHGPDESQRQADLRLDTEAGVASMIAANSLSESELLRRVQSTDDSERMPPPESNKLLTQEQRSLLERWVVAGAPWEQHWAFVPPTLATLPSVVNSDCCSNEIDHFVLNQLEAAGLAPSVAATPAQLIRRLFLDLIGLPPSAEEAEQWIGKVWPSLQGENAGAINEDAYSALVTRLLNAPQYGERWARRWLDLARYADTNGYEKDRDRSIWPYRDWVIEALNQDMPFDQFTIEQIAGDMLPDATEAQRVATGFHRNTMLNEEGGIDPLEFRFHAMTDRMATTGTTWLGLTIGCCQCHTHKYDPISHTEYYQLMAFLNNSDEPSLELTDESVDSAWQKNRELASELLEGLPQKWPIAQGKSNATRGKLESSSTEDKNAERAEALQAGYAAWITAERANHVKWETLEPVTATANLPTLTIQDDHSIFASGDTAKRDDYLISFDPSAFPIHAIQLEALPDGRLPAGGPGSTYYEGTLGDFYLTEISFEAGDSVMQIEYATESYGKNRFGSNPVSAALTIDGDIQTGWSVDGRQGERHVAVYVFAQPVPAGKPLNIKMAFGRHFASSLGRFRFRATSAESKPAARDFSPAIEAVLRRDDSELSDSERDLLFNEFLLRAPELAKESAEIRRLLARPSGTTTLVMSERPSGQGRATHRHHRGEYLQPAEPVTPGIPKVLPQLVDGIKLDRLSFARWLVSRDNPLTARVVVNRQWQAFFGTGIVKTVDDFGLQGEPPSHAALLDYLALDFMNHGWSVKQLHRKIVSSNTYRQSSNSSQTAATMDPENRLLSRMPRFRLEAEVLRDSLLVVSGRYVDTIGGPPVRPPQPAGVTEVAYGSPAWNASRGEDRYRRSIYTFVKRTAPFAMFSAFDAPSGEACLAQRTRSNSPLQALTLLNDVMLVDLSRAAGERFAVPAESTREQIAHNLRSLFMAALVREPDDAEALSIATFFHAQRAAFVADPASALQLLGVNAEQTQGTSGDANAAAWVATARALFGLDEFQTRE